MLERRLPRRPPGVVSKCSKVARQIPHFGSHFLPPAANTGQNRPECHQLILAHFGQCLVRCGPTLAGDYSTNALSGALLEHLSCMFPDSFPAAHPAERNLASICSSMCSRGTTRGSIFPARERRRRALRRDFSLCAMPSTKSTVLPKSIASRTGLKRLPTSRDHPSEEGTHPRLRRDSGGGPLWCPGGLPTGVSAGVASPPCPNLAKRGIKPWL